MHFLEVGRSAGPLSGDDDVCGVFFFLSRLMIIEQSGKGTRQVRKFFFFCLAVVGVGAGLPSTELAVVSFPSRLELHHEQVLFPDSSPYGVFLGRYFLLGIRGDYERVSLVREYDRVVARSRERDSLMRG